MNCELARSEMHKWRDESHASGFEAFFKHLATCPKCSEHFQRITERDDAIRQKFQEFPEPRLLERRILAGLTHERAQARSKGRPWMLWMAAPLLAAALAILAFSPWQLMQEHHLHMELAKLLSQPPTSQMVSTDRQQLLDWSSGVIKGPAQLPPELGRVQFKGATALEVAHHKAVLLKMKNEQRASLVVVDGALTRKTGFTYLAEDSGNASLWSDGRRTYVLLYRGSQSEMQGYMQRMGITA